MITHVAVNHRLGIFKLPLKHLHYHVRQKMYNTYKIEDAYTKGEEGFITENDEFLDRETAKKYAVQRGQIRPRSHSLDCSYLLSEDLLCIS